MCQAMDGDNLVIQGRADAEEQRLSVAPQATATGRSKVAAEGSCLGNTNPQGSQDSMEALLPGCRVSGGFDWLSWSASVKWNPLCFGCTMQEFEWAKAECQEQKLPFKWMDLEGLGSICVYRQGFNWGGDSGHHFEFKISYGNVVLGLAKAECGTSRRPNLLACMKGRDCLLLGAREGFDKVREFIRRLGNDVEWEKVARADFALDVAGLDVRLIQEAAERGQFITSAKSVVPHVNLVGAKRTGLTVGKAPLYMTAYDKLAEVGRKTDELYRLAMIAWRWGGEWPQFAARIEFQALRPWLTEQGVGSPDDLFELSGSLVDKLTDWFWLTTKPVDRENKNQKRAELLPLWAGIQAGFAKVFGEPAGPLVPIERERIHPERLIKTARGFLANAMQQMGRKCPTADDYLFHAQDLLSRTLATNDDAKKFVEEYQRRAARYAL